MVYFSAKIRWFYQGVYEEPQSYASKWNSRPAFNCSRMSIFVFLEEISPQSFHLHLFILPSSTSLKSQLPCCHYYVGVKLIKQSLVKDKQNNVLKISFWACLPVLAQITFVFFVLHFLVCEKERVTLALVGNGLGSPNGSSPFLTQKRDQILSGCDAEQLKQHGQVLHTNSNLLKRRFLGSCSN